MQRAGCDVQLAFQRPATKGLDEVEVAQAQGGVVSRPLHVEGFGVQEAFLGLDVWTRQLVWRAFKGAHPCVQRGDAVQLWQDHPWRPLRRAFGVCSAGGGPSGGQPCGHFGPPCEQGRRHVEVASTKEGHASSAVW